MISAYKIFKKVFIVKVIMCIEKIKTIQNSTKKETGEKNPKSCYLEVTQTFC